MQPRNLWTIILFILIAIGAWSILWYSPQVLIIPGIVVGVVLLLYFYPPQQWRWRQNKRGSAAPYHRTTVSRLTPGVKKGGTKKRHVHLRVIKGNKKDDDEEPPLYH